MKVLDKSEITYENLENELDLKSKKINNILIFGIGGSGINTLNSLKIENNDKTIELAVASNKEDKFKSSNVENKIFLGRKKDGEKVKVIAGFDPSVGKVLAEENIEEIEQYLKNRDLLIIVGGMSGSTATGATPVIINRAKKLNIKTVAIITTPFLVEGNIRKELAKEGVDKIKESADITIIYDSNDLVKNKEKEREFIRNILLELDSAVCGIIKNIIGIIK